MKCVLVTGVAGFIGFHLAQQLLKADYIVIGIDNLNDYYDPKLKRDRLAILQACSQFQFKKLDITNQVELYHLFSDYSFDYIVHLAAQAGVRYSLQNPSVYVQSNLVGFANLLECMRKKPAQHFVYASTSSVYGNNQKYPFTEDDSTDEPISFYAATKKANELMGYSYANLYKIPMTGLRFFTVYGPWGRPDMALFKFTKKILASEAIEVYNNGDLYRDFTYVDDIVAGVIQVLNAPPIQKIPHVVYNIGCGNPVRLEDFITEIERALGKKANKVYLPMQSGDVFKTYADIEKIASDFNYRPIVKLHEGVSQFIEWYKLYYQV